MKPAHHASQSYMRHRDSAEPELDSNNVRPYGRFGVGTLTAHPVGILVVIAVIVIAMVGLPFARLFLASYIVGGVFGFFLWLRNRHRGY